MAEELNIPKTTDKESIYSALLPQLIALVEPESDAIANMANIAAALKQAFGFFWVGFYLRRNMELVLGPFQGPIACTRIGYGKGVCGTAFKNKETIVVPDVDKFPGHIACSSLSKSEIVVPLLLKDEVKLVLDVDSDQFEDFNEIDQIWLNEVVWLLAKHFH